MTSTDETAALIDRADDALGGDDFDLAQELLEEAEQAAIEVGEQRAAERLRLASAAVADELFGLAEDHIAAARSHL